MFIINQSKWAGHIAKSKIVKTLISKTHVLFDKNKHEDK